MNAIFIKAGTTLRFRRTIMEDYTADNCQPQLFKADGDIILVDAQITKPVMDSHHKNAIEITYIEIEKGEPC